MELYASYEELNSYVAERFHQPVTLSFISENEVRVTYTKRIFIKDLSVSLSLRINEVTPDSVTLSYNGKFGLDKVIEGVLCFMKSQAPDMTQGIHSEDNHCIRINLSEIEKARPLVENIVLQGIKANEDGLRITFRLKIPASSAPN